MLTKQISSCIGIPDVLMFLSKNCHIEAFSCSHSWEIMIHSFPRVIILPPHVAACFVLVSQLWDINMDAGPVATFQVHEYLRPKVICYILSQPTHCDLMH